MAFQDPKEKAILALQREVNQLQEENQHLKMLIDLGSVSTPPGLSSFVGNLHQREDLKSPSAVRSAALALAATVGNSGSEGSSRLSFYFENFNRRVCSHFSF